MLSRPQQILLKRAQKEAALDDAEYRDAIGIVSGMADCRSSTDARLADRHCDNLLSYFEAIYWRKVDANKVTPGSGLQHVFKANAIFRQRGYWQSKNSRGNTSRDRYTARTIEHQIAALESALAGYGYTFKTFQAIQNTMRSGGKPFSQIQYAAALKRTLEAKQRAGEPEESPIPF